MARARGRGGSNAEVFSATLRELQDDMNEGTEAGGGPRAVGTGRAPGVPSLEGVAEIAEEMGLAVPPPAFVRGRKDGVWGKSGRGRRKGMSRSAGRKSALDAFFDMMDGEE
ncbi:hypothetical protein CspeluHIS016_0503610 [Cutaneotrichosporon spelunceum]|uniref:Uncharacterized protein n=1 Tax=Cutaneotrichosporon spelunceum TaxID=1672016 RepID=A0AAD3YDV2_9TREE|nr:hypothetical protein CspeluHIS016_0503610 [Cutaneotrichosporon spelunceum]